MNEKKNFYKLKTIKQYHLRGSGIVLNISTDVGQSIRVSASLTLV